MWQFNSYAHILTRKDLFNMDFKLRKKMAWTAVCNLLYLLTLAWEVQLEVLNLQYFFQFTIFSLCLWFESYIYSFLYMFTIAYIYVYNTSFTVRLQLTLLCRHTAAASHHSTANQMHCHTFKCNALVEPKEGSTQIISDSKVDLVLCYSLTLLGVGHLQLI